MWMVGWGCRHQFSETFALFWGLKSRAAIGSQQNPLFCLSNVAFTWCFTIHSWPQYHMEMITAKCLLDSIWLIPWETPMWFKDWVSAINRQSLHCSAFWHEMSCAYKLTIRKVRNTKQTHQVKSDCMRLWSSWMQAYTIKVLKMLSLHLGDRLWGKKKKGS